MRGLRQDFADWRRREPVWSLLAVALMGLLLVGVVVSRTGDDLALAWMWLLYLATKLEVSRIVTLAVRYRVAAELTVQDVRAQMGGYVAASVEESYTAHLRRADALSERAS